MALLQNYAGDIKGKVIFTTGVSPGSLGSHFAQSIAAAGPRCLNLAGRNRSKIQQAADEIKASHPSVETHLEIDLAALDSFRRAASQIHSPFLLAYLIMGKVLSAGGESPRIVIIASDEHRLSGIRMVRPSLWLRRLAARNLLEFSLHHGVTFTNLANHLTFSKIWTGASRSSESAHDRARGDPEGWKGLDPKPLETGVSAHVYAALDLDLAGPWVDPVKPWATSALEAERLWKLSEELVGEKFTY
ncbi:hypothetical protein KXV68_008498 [Aspergillus fumigatus]|nr:hypothetical protein CNMCM8714_004227 [Aspergillus fumigatus]KAF4261364.1 hypothetical protein CNMCM8057_001918 [Aspergillus fumigatus]KAH1304970.1 hypothetical protein KXX11_000364 [Aspergillus fumigatus]KAH1336592.1 hypothetical protein KXX67_002777 [Aspergillus fumigatus]KAH1452717.1 hypothetical protein KXX13_002634 [Aspergillus fumigatus]